jgi:hypothetical protein
MVNFEKSQPEPPSLAVEKLKPNGTYRTLEVIERLIHDFKNKCYLCEQKNPTSINIEHFIPHLGRNIDLKFDWNNLFWACVHCNGCKNEFIGQNLNKQILNCTNPNHEVVNWIVYHLSFFPKENFSFQARIVTDDIQELIENTVELFDKIYNSTTPIRTVEALNLRIKVIDEILDFQSDLREYYLEELTEDEKNTYFHKIRRSLSKESSFTAFKRWYVLEREAIREEFEPHFD